MGTQDTQIIWNDAIWMMYSIKDKLCLALRKNAFEIFYIKRNKFNLVLACILENSYWIITAIENRLVFSKQIIS